MQAIGMVNDHLVDCFRYREVRRLDSAGVPTEKWDGFILPKGRDPSLRSGGRGREEIPRFAREDEEGERSLASLGMTRKGRDPSLRSGGRGKPPSP
jgi:hypothetical protein